MRELPNQLCINTDYEITEVLTLDGVERILLSPSKCYLEDDVVQLEEVIKAIVDRYNEHDVLLSYTAYVDACNKVGKKPHHYRKFRVHPMFEDNIRNSAIEI